MIQADTTTITKQTDLDQLRKLARDLDRRTDLSLTIVHQAADEIDRLRAENGRLRSQLIKARSKIEHTLATISNLDRDIRSESAPAEHSPS
ncbi:MAG TPA: hypothetical protein VH684_11585 [Xanthobacteraceae bacterium]|jgi:HAMP domain-containing protein